MTDQTPDERTPVLSMTVHGFKGVQHVTIEPQGAVVTIAGQNGAGKTSFIDAICELLDPRGVKLGPRLIHDGEKEARATLRTARWTAERVWKKQGAASTLTITSSDGASYPSPAAMLKKLAGQVTFDPTRFMFLDAKDQLAELLAVVDLPFSLEEIERAVAVATEERKNAKAKASQLAAQLAGLTEPAADVPTEPQSTREILEDLKAAQQHNGRRETLEDELGTRLLRIGSLEQELERERAAYDKTKDALREMPPAVDLTPLEERLDSVGEWNSKIEEAARYRRFEAAREEAAGWAANAQEKLDLIVEQKKLGLEAANFPVAGLGFDDTGVTLEGTPFKQVNTARQILVSAEFAMKTKPANVRIMRISHGSLLDSESSAALERLAEEHGYLVLREVVDEHASPETTVVFSEGTATGLGVVE